QVVLQMVQDHPTIDIWEAKVKCYCIWFELACKGQSVLAAPCHQGFELFLMSLIQKYSREGVIVLHNQQDAVIRLDLVTVIFDAPDNFLLLTYLGPRQSSGFLVGSVLRRRNPQR